MSFDWSGFLGIATAMYADAVATKGTPLTEAKLRSAISRAYYAAHHKSKVHVEKSPGVRVSRSGKAHREVIDYLKASKHHPDQLAGVKLDRLLIARERADYFIKYPGDITQAADTAVKDAAKVIAAVAPTEPKTPSAGRQS